MYDVKSSFYDQSNVNNFVITSAYFLKHLLIYDIINIINYIIWRNQYEESWNCNKEKSDMVFSYNG